MLKHTPKNIEPPKIRFTTGFIVKRLLITAIFLLLFTASMMPTVFASEEDTALLGTLLIPAENETFGAVYEKQPVNVYTPVMRSTLPSYVNLTTDEETKDYFPPIRSQYGGSCAAWASTYYQFTYEVARLNDWNVSSDDSKVFSPKYVWNYLNGGEDKGVSRAACFRFLEKQGSVRWSEFPQNSLSFDWYQGENNTATTNALHQALETRVINTEGTGFNFVLPYDKNNANQTPITGNKDSDLNSIKQLLKQKHVLTMDTFVCKWQYGVLDNGEKAILFGCEEYKTDENGDIVIENGKPVLVGHALTIVGYDDNIHYDFNNNNIAEDFEKGAFLIANSWGTNATNHNNGYIWLMYDALNNVSSYSAANPTVVDLEENIGPRKGFIRDNALLYMEVANYTPQLTAEVTIQQSRRNDITVTLGRSSADTNTKSTQTTFLDKLGGAVGFNGSSNSYQTRTFVFDYDDLYTGNTPVYWVHVTDHAFGNGANTTVQKIRWVNSSGTVLKEIGAQYSLNGFTGTYASQDDYGDTYGKATSKSEDSRATGCIDVAGDVDYFKFIPDTTGTYLFYTTGSTDTKGYLYDTSQAQLAYSNNASISGNNFAFKYTLTANRLYYIKVCGADSTKTGSYIFNISKALYEAGLDGGDNQDARKVQMHAQAASILTTLKVTIGDNTYTLSKPASGPLNTTVNGARFKVTFETKNNGLSTAWNITAKIPATAAGTTDTVSFTFSKGTITNVTSAGFEGFVAYNVSIKTGIDARATNSLQKLINSMTSTGYTLTPRTWINTLVEVTSTTKAATGMKIIKTNKSTGKIEEIFFLVLFGDVTGGGTITIGNGIIDSSDALAALQDNVELSQLGELAQIAGDVDRDGDIDASDALLMNQHSVELLDIDQSHVVTTVPDDCYFLNPVAF